MIDFDEAEAQAKFIQKFPQLTHTDIVKSDGRGTLHFYFEVNFLVKTTKIRGGDLKAEGSYVVGAGSQIANGKWEVFNNVPVKRISQNERDEVLSVFTIAQPVIPQSQVDNCPKTGSLDY